MFATEYRWAVIAGTIALGFVVSMIWLGVYTWFKIWPTRGDVPLLKTPEWEFREINHFKGDQFMLRRETNADGALLLKRSDLETVYKYDPVQRSVTAVAETEWDNASGAIAKCTDQRLADIPSVLERNDREHKLFAGKREIRTAGKIALAELTSPSGRWAAVHSAEGPAVQSILPFTGDLIYGQRYHEILSLPDLARVGEPVRVPVNQTRSHLYPCWSADEKFVVYTDVSFWVLVVVETGL